MLEFGRYLDIISDQFPTAKIDRESLMAVYEDGKGAGRKAELAQPLLDLEKQILREHRGLSPRAGLPTELDADAIKYGYAEGLIEFLQFYQVEIPIPEVNKHAQPEGLLRDEVLLGFLRGLRREAPGITRIYKDAGSYILNTVTEKLLAETGRAQLLSELGLYAQILVLGREMRRGGYTLGITTWVVRESGERLLPSEVPADDFSFFAFTQGLDGQTKPLPSNYEERDELVDLRTLEFEATEQSMETTYKAGLRVWLTQQGATANYVHFIRHPLSLAAFKKGLEGNNPQHEQASQIINFQRTWRDYDYITSTKFPSNKYSFIPNPKELERAQAFAQQLGYNLWKLKNPQKLPPAGDKP